ncbi:MAG: penicillin-binding protein 2 [Candidatus Omnitrophica bacterium]|nr:penicillin-binding protein 2 [Candidatus Omnitrophota bacterium]
MRLKILKNLIILGTALLIICLWYLQCVENERYKILSQNNRIRIVPLVAPRGNIYDRNMNLLAGSRLAFDCAIIPQEFDSESGQLGALCLLLGEPLEAIRDIINKNTIAPFAPLTLKKDIGKETAIKISEKIVDLPGVIIHTYPARFYPHANACAHVTGYVGKINEDELSVLRDYGYKMRDVVGRGGLELYYDDYLKGESGGRQTEVDSRGRELRSLGIKEPEKGLDIMTTIDIDLQEYASSLLEGLRGSIIVLESETGQILSMVSKPDYDPNIFIYPDNSLQVKRLLDRKDYPFVNRGISGLYPPGSVFKVVTATAALELGKIGDDERLNCNGYYMIGNRRFNCWRKKGHGSQKITEAIRNSCNVFFYQLGLKAGPDALTDFAERYQLNLPTNIDLPYEKSGVVPSGSWKRRFRKEAWYKGDTLNFAIGQGYLSLTPIGILKVYNTIAQNGYLITPIVVKNIGNVDVYNVEKSRINVTSNTFAAIKRGVGMAVEDENGTAHRAYVGGVDVAGKTGTAQTGAASTHAWFAGFAPNDKPRIAIVIFVEHGGKGGSIPCEIASKIFTKLKELEYL